MVHIPTHIQELVSYKPGKPVAQIVNELGLTETAILWNNESNLGPSPLVSGAVSKAASELHRYPDPLSTALRERLAEINRCHIDQIVIDNGSESLLDNIFRAFFNADDELLTCDGTFVALYIWAKANNRTLAKIPLTATYGFDVDGLISSVNPKTKAIYIANPNNPTGAKLTSAELKKLISAIPDHVLIIVDEAYFEYARALSVDYPDSFSWCLPNVITLRTLSKAYGIAGMRIGYALGSENLIEAMVKVKMTFAPSNIAQAAGIAALQDTQHLERSIALNKSALQQFYTALDATKIDYIPSFGNFVMLDLKTPQDAVQFALSMMKRGVFVRHLTAFGLPHCIRVTTGTERENDLFVRVLGEM